MYKELTEATSKPELWSAYTAEILWADPHIARQMLGYHLNPEIEAASRSFDFIDQSVNWLITEFYPEVEDFRLISAEEVTRGRATRLANPLEVRQTLLGAAKD